MKILIPETPQSNSYVTSLIQAYQKAGCTVICGEANFYFTDFVPDVLHIQWPESLVLNRDFGMGSHLRTRFFDRIDWFKAQGTHYQSHINAVLEAAKNITETAESMITLTESLLFLAKPDLKPEFGAVN